ncbi:unnamed protein product [Rhizophagus irregularis]|nr:unnamed protein product [Rhizophagus irregularis]
MNMMLLWLAKRASEYNINCMVDMKQKTYSFKHQLESQHNSRSAELEKQYKSRISTLDKSIVRKDKEIGKLSSTISQLKNEKRDIKKNADAGRNGTIEPNTFNSFHEAEYWARKWRMQGSSLILNSTLTGCRLIVDSTLSGCRLIVDLST